MIDPTFRFCNEIRVSMEHLPRLLAVARGDVPADLVLAGGRVVNTFTGEIEDGLEVAIADGYVAGLGRGYRGARSVDLEGAYLAPGLIDAHVHIESSLCVPPQFAAAVLPRGVTGVVADPHEIANVAGTRGVRFIADASANLPLNVTVMAPSCVPATGMASSGGSISADDLYDLRGAGVVRGLGEVMNFPAVVDGNPDVLAKLAAMSERPIDGHCPGVSGKRLCAYAAAGVGSDHECVSAEEAREKLARGLYLLVREATNARNLDALLPVITPKNSRRVCFCTDDRTPVELLSRGSVDEMVRRAIAFAIDPVEAIRMATLNTAEWFGLRDLGAIAPGRFANAFVFDDLRKPEARMVFSRGRLVAKGGRMLDEMEPSRAVFGEEAALGRCEIAWDSVRFNLPAKSQRVRVIGSLPDQLVTENRVMTTKVESGNAVADLSRDLLKMMVIERHHRTGNVGVGFVQGFGICRGAIAGTVAHDHHNLVCIGVDDVSMQTAARAAATSGGGLAVAAGERVLARLPLPVGGLMSDRPVAEVAAGYADVVNAATRELSSTLADPFMAMSFMALEVIPSLKLTDKGLVDVEQFRIVDLFV
jgi:adenine deaminase